MRRRPRSCLLFCSSIADCEHPAIDLFAVVSCMHATDLVPLVREASANFIALANALLAQQQLSRQAGVDLTAAESFAADRVVKA